MAKPIPQLTTTDPILPGDYYGPPRGDYSGVDMTPAGSNPGSGKNPPLLPPETVIPPAPPKKTVDGPPNNGDSGTQNPDTITRLGDLLERMLNQGVYVPDTGSPVVVPTQSQGSAVLPIVIIAGAGAAMWYYYKHKGNA